MKVTFVGHASLLVEAAGITVLSDPWWAGPCFGAQWWIYPKPFLEALEGKRIDYIYLSHGHHDHLHAGTLATLPKTAKVLVSASGDLAAGMRELGFDVIEVAAQQTVALGDDGLTARIIPTHGDDTLLALADGREVCLNLNDALHSAPEAAQDAFIKQLRALYPNIDYVFCGYGVASHFPNCYSIPGKDAQATASRRQAYFNRQWVRVIAGLKPRWAFPFAADVVFLQDELFWANEATHNPERPTDVFRSQHPNSATRVVDIAPGFAIADGEVRSMVTRKPVQEARLREEMSEQIARANRVGRDSEAAISEVARLFESNLANCNAYLATFAGDYTIALRFINSPTCLVLQKRSAHLELQSLPSAHATTQQADLVFATRLAYLRWALQRPYGDEILFVGSGGIFEYANRAQAARALHRELICVIRNQPPASRVTPAGRAGLIFRGKQFVKRMLGRNERDLYDLLGWTVFDRGSASR